jgi:alpha-ketoglutarate-dependent taurine dioxygenase
MFEVTNASPRVGATVRTTKQDMLAGTYAARIEELLLERSALAFPGMNFTEDEQLRFASTIGKVFLVGGKETQNISLDPSINPTADYTRGAFFWHIDGANDDIPAKATMLTARILSEPGTGDTLVANTFAAYEDLPEEDKARIAPLKVRHRLEASQRMVTPEPTYEELKRWQAYKGRTHPLVWTHRNGAKSLLIGASALYVEGMDYEESSALLTRLRDFATQPQYVFRHTWAVGDFLLWDNTGTMHKADSYPLDSKRLMLRTTLHGEESIQ